MNLKVRNFTLIVVLLITLVSCEKGPETSPAELPSDFTLSRHREYADGRTTVDVETALNLDEATGFNASLNIKDQSLILTIGGRKVTTVEPKIWASVVFRGKLDPQSILGTYTFPGDLANVDIFFLENTASGFYGRSWPASGTLTIAYNSTTHSYYGEIKKLKYEIPFRADYIYEEFNATFKQVKFRQ